MEEKRIPPYMDYDVKAEETMEDKGALVQIDLTREICVADEVEVILGNYEFVFKNGKTYFIRKKPQYPKTYIECAIILNCFSAAHIEGYKNEMLEKLQELLICRGAYWKIAGEKMELGKPWEPDWKSSDLKYVIKTMGDEICKPTECTINCFLAFPTEEMRDTFYKYFKDLIERCKKLL